MQDPYATNITNLYFHSATVPIQEVIWQDLATQVVLETDSERGTTLSMFSRSIMEKRKGTL